MSLLTIKKGSSANLNSVSITDGQLLVTTDTKKIYLDNGSNRLLLNAGVADSAIKDGAGNVITSKYVTLDTSQTITADKKFNSNVDIDGGGSLKINTTLLDHTNPTNQCLVINSASLEDSNVSNITDKNAPGIGFHIGGYNWASLIFSDKFKFINNTADGYVDVVARTFEGDLSGTATKAIYIKDSYNGNNINISYGNSGLSSATWFAAWNNYELRAISAVTTRTVIGAAAASHTHSYDSLGLYDGFFRSQRDFANGALI